MLFRSLISLTSDSCEQTGSDDEPQAERDESQSIRCLVESPDRLVDDLERLEARVQDSIYTNAQVNPRATFVARAGLQRKER